MITTEAASRNEQIVTFTLVELLTQLVFVAMLLAVVLRDEEHQKFADPAQRIARLEAEIASLNKERRELLAIKAYLEDQLSQRPPGQSPSVESTRIPTRALTEFQAWKERQAKGRGGKDRPACPGIPGFVLEIRLPERGGIAGRWIGPPGMAPSAIPGMADLASGTQLTVRSFRAAAGAADGWARSRGCGLRVIIRAGRMIDTRRQNLVRQYFYESTR